MNAKIVVLALTTVSLLLSTTNAEAQFARRGRGAAGWGPGSEYGRIYDPKTVQSVEGDVVRVDKFKPGKGTSAGVHLLLKTNTEEISVHLGPSWYIDNQEIHIKPKDKITVKGSRVTFGDKPALIAAEVTKGGDLLRLRDENGIPVWAGWRRR